MSTNHDFDYIERQLDNISRIATQIWHHIRRSSAPNEFLPDVDDMANDAAIHLMRNRAKLENAPQPVVDRSISNSIISHDVRPRKRKHQVKEVRFYGLDRAPDRNPNPEQLMILGERRRNIAAALADLPEMERRIVILHALKGLSYREIARRLGMNFSRVRDIYLDARAKLQPRLAIYARDAFLAA